MEGKMLFWRDVSGVFDKWVCPYFDPASVKIIQSELTGLFGGGGVFVAFDKWPPAWQRVGHGCALSLGLAVAVAVAVAASRLARCHVTRLV